jgi:hypothetical protein
VKLYRLCALKLTTTSVPNYVTSAISHKLSIAVNLVWEREIMGYFTKLFFINGMREKLIESKNRE